MDTGKLIFVSIEREELVKLIEESIKTSISEIQLEKPQEEELLTRKQVADFYKTSLVSLRAWEVNGIIPKPIRKASRVYWRKSDIVNDIRSTKKVK